MRIKRPLVWVFASFCLVVCIVNFFHSEITPTLKKEDTYLKGIIVSDPTITKDFYNRSRYIFILKQEKARCAKDEHWQALPGLIRVTSYRLYEPLQYGDEVLLKGKLYTPKSFGTFDYKRYLERHRIHYCFDVGKTGFVKVLDTGKGNWLVSAVLGLKGALREIIFRNIPGHIQQAVVGGILLGDRDQIPREVKQKFVDTGTVHVLAISGLHVAFMAFLFFVVFSLFRIPKRVTHILVILILITYAIMTGGRTPVVRAAIMASVFLLGFILRRPADLLNTLALSGIIILAKNPMQLYDAGFQLSFAAVASIAHITPLMKPRGYLRKAFAVSIAAWVGVAPIVAYHFGIISPIAVIANVFVVLLLSLVVTTGLTVLCFGFFSQALAFVFGESCGFFTICLVKTVEFFHTAPFGYFKVPSLSLIFVIGYYILLIMGLRLLRPSLDSRQKHSGMTDVGGKSLPA